MKLAVIFAALAISAMTQAQAQTVGPVLPWGPWVLCSTGFDFPGCPIAPGTETYAIRVMAANPQTIAYAYSVSATLKTGAAAIVTGVVGRTQDAEGAMYIVFGPGGVIDARKQIVVTVYELGILGIVSVDRGLK